MGVLQFIKVAGKWGWASVFGTVIFILVSLYEYMQDKQLASYAFVCLAALIFCAGAYKAWGEESKKAEKLKLQIDNGRPHIHLEILTHTGKESFWRTDAFTAPMFSITNFGQRAARHIRFDPIQSESRKWTLQLETIPLLVPDKIIPLGYTFGYGNNGSIEQDISRLLLFFEEKKTNGKYFYPVTVHFLDVDGTELQEGMTIESTIPHTVLKVLPASRQPLGIAS